MSEHDRLRRDPLEYDETCDGCAQARSECLCGIDLAEVLDCASPFHPGCRACEDPTPGQVVRLTDPRRGHL